MPSATFWVSLRALFGETQLSVEDAFALGAPSAEEEQKRAVLRAIKDLEFEHSVGKISKKDFDILIAKYRADAKRLLRVLDERAAPERDKVEALVADHLRKKGIKGVGDEGSGVRDEGSGVRGQGSGEPKTDDEAEAKADAEVEAEAAEAEAEAEAAAELDVPKPVAKVDRNACPKCSKVNDEDAAFCKKCGTKLGDDDDDDWEDDE